MGMYSITGWSGGGRRPLTYNLKAGQFRGMGRVNVYPSKTTIVNNNFIGGGYGMYNNYECCNNSTPKWLNWMMGIGIGTSLLGGILNMFGIGGNGGTVEGAGGKEEPQETKAQDPTQSKEYKDLNKKLDKALDEIAELKKQSQAYQAQQAETLEPVNDNTPEVAATPQDIKQQVTKDLSDGTIVKVRDEKLGSRADITGTVTNNADGTISIKDIKNTYTYQKLGQTITYKGKEYPVYECTGAVDNKTGQTKTISKQQYILINGELIQPSDLDLSGSGSGTVKNNTQAAQAPQATPAGQAAQAQSEVPEGTLKDQISNSYSSITPYFHKEDGKWHATPDNEHSYRDINTPLTNNAQQNKKNYTLVNGQTVNIQGAKVGKYPKNNASQRDSFYLQTSDGKTINISRADYYSIQDQLS